LVDGYNLDALSEIGGLTKKISATWLLLSAPMALLDETTGTTSAIAVWFSRRSARAMAANSIPLIKGTIDALKLRNRPWSRIATSPETIGPTWTCLRTFTAKQRGRTQTNCRPLALVKPRTRVRLSEVPNLVMMPALRRVVDYRQSKNLSVLTLILYLCRGRPGSAQHPLCKGGFATGTTHRQGSP
jgi:hypothetical protein